MVVADRARIAAALRRLKQRRGISHWFFPSPLSFDVISESACVNAKTDGTGRTQSSLRPQKGAWNYSPGVSHSSCEPEAHDVLALTPGWSDLDQDLDPDTSVFAAARGTRLRPDAAPPLQSLSDVLCVRAVFDTTG